jgi:hypothetical protein
MTSAHMTMTTMEATPADVGSRYIRWGLGLFVWTWLGIQGACIFIYLVGVTWAYVGVTRASHVLALWVHAER